MSTYSREVTDALIARDFPTDDEVRNRLESWMARTGMTEADVAETSGYSRSTINLFRLNLAAYRTGRFDTGTLALKANLLTMMNDRPARKQRRSVSTIYRTDSYRKIREAFFSALERGWAYCVDGAPGTQKTTIALALAEEVQKADKELGESARRVVYVRARPNIKPRDLLVRITMAAGISTRGNVDQLLNKIRTFFETGRALLVVDEAQALDNAGIETLRELLDEPPYFGLLFMGSHDLQKKFHDLRLEQWRSRLQNVICLSGLTEDEAREIAASELGSISEKQLKILIEGSRVRDFRVRTEDGHGTYLSARNLFFAIEQTKHARAKQRGSERTM